MKLLIIEDNEQLANNLQLQFRIEKAECDVVYTGIDGLNRIESIDYDCIILDLQLPDMDGEEVCKTIRNNQVSTPILILTAKNSKKSIARNLIIGADDYVTKPFSFEELAARVKALVRRAENKVVDLIKLNNITIDRSTQRVFLDGKNEINLSPKEYDLLDYLVSKRGKVQNRLEIIENVWGDRDELLFSQTVDVHIAYLRKKIGKEVIKTGKEGYYVE